MNDVVTTMLRRCPCCKDGELVQRTKDIYECAGCGCEFSIEIGYEDNREEIVLVAKPNDGCDCETRQWYLRWDPFSGTLAKDQ